MIVTLNTNVVFNPIPTQIHSYKYAHVCVHVHTYVRTSTDAHVYRNHPLFLPLTFPGSGDYMVSNRGFVLGDVDLISEQGLYVPLLLIKCLCGIIFRFKNYRKIQ